MTDALGIVVAALSAITLAAGLATGLIRYMLLPYLREHLEAPVKQVEKQVTENHHHNDEPTVLDRIEDVHQEVRTLARVYDHHLTWSEQWAAQIEAELATAKRHNPHR